LRTDLNELCLSANNMAKNRKRPLTDYIEAFARYAPWANKVFHTRAFGHHALINDGAYVYQVSHFEDLIADYAVFFNDEPGMIYTEFPAALWSTFLKEKLSLSNEDLVIDLYRAWQLFWEKQVSFFMNDALYKSAKKYSYRHFNRLVAITHDGPDRMLEMATALDQTVFLPVIALAVKYQYTHEDEFFSECVRLMSEKFADQFGDGLIFIKVAPDGHDHAEKHTFFIYSVDEDF
jgi:hypothetical protein